MGSHWYIPSSKIVLLLIWSNSRTCQLSISLTPRADAPSAGDKLGVTCLTAHLFSLWFTAPQGFGCENKPPILSPNRDLWICFCQVGKPIIFLGFTRHCLAGLHFRRWFLGQQTGLRGAYSGLVIRCLPSPLRKVGECLPLGYRQLLCYGAHGPLPGACHLLFSSHWSASFLSDSLRQHEVLWPNVSQSAYFFARFILWYFSSKAFDQLLFHWWTPTDSSDLVSRLEMAIISGSFHTSDPRSGCIIWWHLYVNPFFTSLSIIWGSIFFLIQRNPYVHSLDLLVIVNPQLIFFYLCWQKEDSNLNPRGFKPWGKCCWVIIFG